MGKYTPHRQNSSIQNRKYIPHRQNSSIQNRKYIPHRQNSSIIQNRKPKKQRLTLIPLIHIQMTAVIVNYYVQSTK